MNPNLDETDRSTVSPGVLVMDSTTTDHNVNSKMNNNVTTTISPAPTTNHPLYVPSINNNNNNDDAFNDDDNMTEITLKTSTTSDNNNSSQSDTKINSNWVKFDDEDGGGGDNNNKNNNNSNDISTTIISNNNNNISNNNSNLEISKTKLLPPPQQQQQQNKNSLNAPPPAVSSATTTTVTTTTIHQSHKPLPSTSLDVGAAILTTESVHVNLNSSSATPQKPNSLTNATSISTSPTSTTSNAPKSVAIPMSSATPPMRTIELSTGRIREGFANGDVIVTLLPINTKWPWITPAVFRPELVPEELMAQGLTLTVEEYVNAMETLVNDYRFTVYNICYKRVLVCWIIFAFCVLLTLLFSGLQGIALFSLGVAWLFLNAAAIFLCMWVKLRLSRGLEKCLARVNKQLLRHKILLVLDDRGRISCHKVNLCFMYFDPELCIAYLNEFIERHEQNGTNIQAGWEKKLDLDVNDIVIQGSNPVRLSRKQEKSVLLYLRYASRWGNEIVRGLIDVSVTEPARHCAKSMCACQYIERHLVCKPRGKFKIFNMIYWVLASERYEN